jgi:serine/threonine protein kinase
MTSKVNSDEEEGGVKHQGGPTDYLAPEIIAQNSKFTKKCDVFAAGIVFLELITLKTPDGLYAECWPRLMAQRIPESIIHILSQSLDSDPANRSTFSKIRKILESNRERISAITESKIVVDVDDVW